MRTTYRVGRGVYLTGGGGLYAFVTAMWLARGVMMLLLIATAVVLTMTFVLTAMAYRNSTHNRYRLAASTLVCAIDPNRVGQGTAGRVQQVVGLYAIGGLFFTGRYPRKGEELAQLYADRSDNLVCVGLFPDSTTANQAKRSLQRNGFRSCELARLLPSIDADSVATRTL